MNNQINMKKEVFASGLASILKESRNPPPSGQHVIMGMEIIKDLYLQHPATEENASLIIVLVECLFYRYDEFGTCYAAVAKALSGDDFPEAEQLLTAVGPNATFGDMARNLER